MCSQITHTRHMQSERNSCADLRLKRQSASQRRAPTQGSCWNIPTVMITIKRAPSKRKTSTTTMTDVDRVRRHIYLQLVFSTRNARVCYPFYIRLVFVGVVAVVVVIVNIIINSRLVLENISPTRIGFVSKSASALAQRPRAHCLVLAGWLVGRAPLPHHTRTHPQRTATRATRTRRTTKTTEFSMPYSRRWRAKRCGFIHAKGPLLVASALKRTRPHNLNAFMSTHAHTHTRTHTHTHAHISET